jgi:aldehyde dehydrogenase (NAD+)
MSYLSEADIAFGGHHDQEQLFIAPTIIRNVSLEQAVMKEEIFGPILPIIPFHDKEDALAVIRRNPNPLSFYLFTADIEKEKSWMNSVSFGSGCINNTGWQFANHHMPFGGIGASGMGAYHGKYSFYQFTHAKPMMKTPTWIDPRIKYPPFTGKLKWFKRFIH